jgi:small ligand-binding sensory domain FIST
MSTLFRHGHATHPDWRMATELALAQVDGQARDARHCARPNLGFAYVTPALAGRFDDIAALLRERTGLADWVGTVGHAICASGAEYADEPAVSLMLAELPARIRPALLGRRRLDAHAAAPRTALVHADPATPDLPELIVDMAAKTTSGAVFGGLASGSGRCRSWRATWWRAGCRAWPSTIGCRC